MATLQQFFKSNLDAEMRLQLLSLALCRLPCL